MGIFIKTFTKILAFLTAVLCFLIIISLISNLLYKNQRSDPFINISGDINSPNKIAILKLHGPILNESSKYIEMDFFNKVDIIYVNQIEKILDDLISENIKGLIVTLNSPGGSVSASYALYNIFSKYKKKHNLIIFFHTKELLASGAYWVALSGNKIFANYGSLVGSIGVKGPDWIYFDEPLSMSSGLFGTSVETKYGIKKFNNIAGSSKDLFDPFRPPTKKEMEDLQNSVQDIYNDFVIAVEKNRKLETKLIKDDIGAMIYNTKKAKEKFLIDDIASLDTVIEKMINYLNFSNNQILEFKYNQPNLLFEILNTKFFSQKYFDFVQQKQLNEICNISIFGITAMINNNSINTKC